MKSTLEIDSIVFDIAGHRILSDIYIKLETGLVTGLLGRNGAGKSSLMKIIFGTLDPLQKAIRLEGKMIKSPYLFPGLINYLPQFHCFPKNRKITALFKDFKVSYEEFKSRFPELITEELPHIGQLSGGNQRFVETYLLLFTPGLFVLLDEPLSNLSPVMITAMCSLIKEASGFKGILLSDHYYRDVLHMSDHVYFLQSGKAKLIHSEQELHAAGYLPGL